MARPGPLNHVLVSFRSWLHDDSSILGLLLVLHYDAGLGVGLLC